MKTTKLALSLLALMVFTPAANASTKLAIADNTQLTCDNEFQNINGNWIAPPQCQDQHPAKVANSYAKSVSARQIRQSPAMKSKFANSSVTTHASLPFAIQSAVNNYFTS